MEFKILLLVYEALNGLGPKVRVRPLGPLSFSRTGSLIVPGIGTKCAESAFSSYASQLWNKLLASLILSLLLHSSALKTFLFTAAFP